MIDEFKRQNELLTYEQPEGAVGLHFDGKTIWGTQAQIGQLFDTTKQNVSYHINNIVTDGEIKSPGVKEILTPVENGQVHSVRHYDLDMIISVGYRVNSQRSTTFRQWSTSVLSEKILDVVTMSNGEYDQLRDNTRRRVSRRNVRLAAVAKEIGVRRFGLFNDARYRGLYDKSYAVLKAYKQIGDDNLLDRIGPDELVLNELSMFKSETAIRGLLKTGRIVGEVAAIATTYSESRKVRQDVMILGDPLPEDMHAEPDHIKDVRRRMRPSKSKRVVHDDQISLL